MSSNTISSSNSSFSTYSNISTNSSEERTQSQTADKEERKESTQQVISSSSSSSATDKVARMSEVFASDAEIRNATTLDGMTISQIAEKAHKYGMLNNQEYFKEILLKDWKNLREVSQVTHIELADYVNKIFTEQKVIYEERANKKPKAEDALLLEDEITTEPSLMNHFKAQKLHANYDRMRGVQEYILFAEGHNNEVCGIENDDRSLGVEWTPGLYENIRRYGFYRSGRDESQYHHTDPLTLLSIVTGESLESLQKKADKSK
ncbi:MAG: hypothetical protein JWO53_49 [Chlamydiia bacterium]|nr:hypothetical protein [Chlamydiia bacterium]